MSTLLTSIRPPASLIRDLSRTVLSMELPKLGSGRSSQTEIPLRLAY
jgi:hypothetical protein